MSVTTAICDHLKGTDAVAAIVDDKIERSWVIDEDPPYITIVKILDGPEHHMTAASALTTARIQVDCWATDRYNAEALSTAVREAMDGRPSGTMGDDNVPVRMLHLDNGPVDMDTPPTDKSGQGVYRDMLEFLVAYTQSVPTFA